MRRPADTDRRFHRLLIATGVLVGAMLACPASPGGDSDLLPLPDDPWFESGYEALQDALSRVPDPGRADNVILFIGDGMSIGTVTAARILEGQLRGEPGEGNLLSFEELPFVALAKTYTTNQQVPDSAGTMTAMMSGVKTKARVIGVDDRVRVADHRSVGRSRVASLLERAEARGLSTGVVTTTRITHATPAACYAHVPFREWEDDSDLPDAARADGFADIARQLVEQPIGDGIEVALGGGRRSFLPRDQIDPEYPELRGRRGDGRNLMEEWLKRHPRSAVVWNEAQLRAVDRENTDHLLGLFEPSHMQYELDREDDPAGEPSLAEMTAAAIDILARNPRGFFLMVEGGRIDHAHHATNAIRALYDTMALSDAVRAAQERVDPQRTLIIVTADHGHTLTLAGYPTRGNPILGLVASNDLAGRPTGTPALDVQGHPYTTLGYANGPGYVGASTTQPEGSKEFPHRLRIGEGITTGRPDLTDVDTAAPNYLQEVTVPLNSETHSGEDVAVYAGGPAAALFHGVREQNYVYHVMVEALGWTREPVRSPQASSSTPGATPESAPASRAKAGSE